MMEVANLALEANGHTANGKAAAPDLPPHSGPAPAPQPAATFSLQRTIRELPPIRAILCVALGGAVGALLRYGFIQACASYQTSASTHTSSNNTITITLHKPFPLSTFVSNMLGCLLIGLLSILLPALVPSPATLVLWRSLCVTGFIGALTTMSSFVLDTADLWQHQHSTQQNEPGVVVVQSGAGREWVGVVYWLCTNVGGIALVVVGRRVARWIERWYVREMKQQADVNGSVESVEQASDVKRAVAREIVEEHKEQAMVEEGESIDVNSDKR